MKLGQRVRSISYLKAHAAELIRELAKVQEPLIITQNGEARAVLLDVASFDAMQETMALVKVLSLADRERRDGLTQSAADAIAALRESES